MEKITLSEAMMLKSNMEHEILLMISDFQSKTGLEVESIKITTTNSGNNIKPYLTQIECKITL